MVTVCPLCQMSLEMRQTVPPKAAGPSAPPMAAGPSAAGAKMPLFYFTELIGLAFGLEEAQSWWKKHLISPVSLLRSVGL